jgi:colanic acid biosynthesis glycosyl transferase WcaI
LRILYLAQFFEPEPMIKGASFVKGLVARGHEVEVVTGFPNYPLGRLYDGYRLALHRKEIVEGVEIHRVPLYPSHGRSSLGRILNYLTYVVSATFYGIFAARRFDVIYAYPPPTVGLAAAAIGFVRRRPFILDVQDLWPESVVKSGMRGTSRMVRLLSLMCRFVYRRARRIVAQSRGIAARLAERGVPPEKIDIVFNWADEAAAAPLGNCDLDPYDLAGKFNFIYGGNLGRVQGLDTLVRAAHLARTRVPELQLTLIGNGVEGASLRALCSELGATNVRVEPGVPRTQIGDIFAAADVLVLHLLDDPLFEITVPQKTQFYMAMGKPVLIGVRGEAARLVLDAKAGLAAEPENVESIADAMVRMANMPQEELASMGARGLKAYQRQFSFAKAIEGTEAALFAARTDVGA